MATQEQERHYSPLYMGIISSACISILGMIVFLLYYYVTRGITHDKDIPPIYTRGFHSSRDSLN
jgi:hypothetical protein